MIYTPRRYRDSNVKVLRPVRANAGIGDAFRRALLDLIRQMHDETLEIIRPTYRDNPPELATDAVLSSAALRNAMAQLAQKWLGRFDQLSHRLADYFTRDVAERSDRQLMRILKQGGFTVNFSLTPGMRDVIDSIVNENVSLIKSIPQQYLTQVEGSVMRSVQTGRDLSTLTSELQDHFGVTRRRAELIARDQNNKATSALTRVRQMDLGIKEGIWRHSHAGKVPRPTHVAMNGKKYDLSEGLYDENEGRNVFPGELINCRCFSQPILPGL